MPSLVHGTEYDTAGSPRAPAIIFLHGSSETRRMWEPQMLALADEFRTIAPDFPAHGALANLPFRMEDVAERLANLIDLEAGGQAVLTGISLGGYVSMEFATRHPQRIAGLVLLSCTAEPTGPGTSVYYVTTAFMKFVPIAWLRAGKAFIVRLLLQPEFRGFVTGDHFLGGAQGIREVLGRSFIAKVRDIHRPILFINGKRDLAFRSSESRFLRAARRGRLEVISRAYHVCNLDAPERVSGHIRDFARECFSSARASALSTP